MARWRGELLRVAETVGRGGREPRAAPKTVRVGTGSGGSGSDGVAYSSTHRTQRHQEERRWKDPLWWQMSPCERAHKLYIHVVCPPSARTHSYGTRLHPAVQMSHSDAAAAADRATATVAAGLARAAQQLPLRPVFLLAIANQLCSIQICRS